MNRIRRIKRGLIPLVQLFVAWQLLAWMLKTPAFPPPYPVIVNLITRTDIPLHAWVSLWRTLRAIVISIVIAVPVGIWVGGNDRLYRTFSPFLYLLYPIPKVAFLPVIMLLLGLGDSAKIFLMVLVILFQILVSVMDARRGIDRFIIDSIATLGPNRWQMLWHVLLPAVLPRVLTSVRVSVGTALAILFFAETFGTELGLGYYITDAWMRLNYQDMFAGIAALSLLGLLLFQAINWIEGKLCKWRS